ncbi:MAG: DNA primase catalytic subunit PriS [Candidatus Hodarchaeales archaeon]|jgi:DNA primase small subunit
MTTQTKPPSKSKLMKALKRYFEEEFTPDQLLKVIEKDSFSNREFGYQDLDKHFNRNISFEDVDRMVDFLREKTPTAFYAGAVYSKPPTRDQPIHKLKWEKREFVFDIDLDQYDAVRTCGCKGATQICEICWEHVKTAAYFINDTLANDFGIKKKDIQWVFSGRRGVHAWIKSDQFSRFDQDLRAAMIDYMSLIKGDNIFPIPRKDKHPTFEKRVIDIVIKRFLEITTKEDLLAHVGLTKKKVDQIIKQREEGANMEVLKNFLLSGNIKVKNPKILESIIKLHYPRIDHKVSIDLRRLLRLPGSIHGETGNVVTFLTLKELESFNPIVDADNIIKRYFDL